MFWLALFFNKSFNESRRPMKILQLDCRDLHSGKFGSNLSYGHPQSLVPDNQSNQSFSPLFLTGFIDYFFYGTANSTHKAIATSQLFGDLYVRPIGILLDRPANGAPHSFLLFSYLLVFSVLQLYHFLFFILDLFEVSGRGLYPIFFGHKSNHSSQEKSTINDRPIAWGCNN